MKKTEVKDVTYYQNKILKMFQDKAGKFSSAEIFDDWLDISVASNQLRLNGQIANYINIHNHVFGKYKCDKTILQLFSDALHTLYEGLGVTKSDILGGVFIQLHPKENFGKSFIPHPICELMTEITAQSPEKIKKIIEKDGVLGWSDPTCGSGSLLVDAFRYAVENGIDTNKIIFYGNDIDKRCAQMTFLQLELLGTNGMVEIDNTSADITSSVFITTENYVKAYGEEKLATNIAYCQMVLDLCKGNSFI